MKFPKSSLLSLAALLLSIVGCRSVGGQMLLAQDPAGLTSPYLLVLGTAQDAGLPQLGCRRECCERVRRDPSQRRFASSLLLVDPRDGRRWLLDASPDLREQVELARGHGSAGHYDANTPGRPALFDGIFLTHAHMGHYAGLLHLGREAYGTATTPVYGTPRLCGFLESNGPWDLLVQSNQLAPQRLAPGESIALAPDLHISAIPVPHREEYSDTVAFRIEGPGGVALYLPDIDKWERWEQDLGQVLQGVDWAFLDATFFDGSEIPGRAMSEVPHPFIVETIDSLAGLPRAQRRKVQLIHLNHSNPAAVQSSAAAKRVRAAGLAIAREGTLIPL